MSLRALFLAGLIVSVGMPVAAENATPYSGMQTVETGKPFEEYADALRAATKANKMGVVAEACAHCGAKSIGVDIPKNRVIMVFAPPYAVRMLNASVPSGIEAPLRLYLTEQADGTANVTYRLPSQVFAAYEVEDLTAMGKELDVVIARIVDEAKK